MFRLKNVIILFLLFLSVQHSIAKAITPGAGFSFTVIVLDSSQNSPLQLARVALRRKGVFVQGKVTDITGRAQFKEIPAGWYVLSVSFVGYAEYNDSLFLDNKILPIRYG